MDDVIIESCVTIDAESTCTSSGETTLDSTLEEDDFGSIKDKSKCLTVPRKPEMVEIEDYKFNDLNNTEVEILLVEDPHKIWMRRKQDRIFFDNMCSEIHRFSCSAKLKNSVEILSGGAYLCLIAGKYNRAIVQEVAPSITVFLLDVGKTCNVSRDEIFQLPPALANFPNLCFSFKLSGISLISPVNNAKSAEKLTAINDQRKTVLRNVVENLENDDDCAASYIGDMESMELVEEKDGVLFGPDSKIITDSVADILIRYGLVKRIKSVRVSKKNSIKESPEVDITARRIRKISVSEADEDKSPNVLQIEEIVPFPDSLPGVFRGIITGIDDHGVIWILPEQHFNDRAKLTAQRCFEPMPVEYTSKIQPGDILFMKKEQSFVRVYITKVLFGGIFEARDMDYDFKSLIVTSYQLYLPPDAVKSIPVITVPLQLYGIKRVIEDFNGARVYEILKTMFPTLLCKIYKQLDTPRFPLQVSAHMMNDQAKSPPGNLAFILNESKYFEFYASHKEWLEEVTKPDYWIKNYVKDILTEPLPLTLPLNVSMHYPFSVIAFGNTGASNNSTCTLRTINCNLIFVQPDYLPRDLKISNLNNDRITASLDKVEPVMASLREMFTRRKHYYERVALETNPTDSLSVGKKVLALYEDEEDPEVKEWARAKILTVHGKEAKVYFQDYGHGSDGAVNIRNLRDLSWKDYLEPEFCLRARFELPDTDVRLNVIRKALSEPGRFPRIAKIREIYHERKEIFISIYELKEVEGELHLKKII